MFSLIVEWIGTILTLVGAVLTSVRNESNIYFLNLGSLCWVVWAVLNRRLSIFLVNFGLLLIYFYGIMRESGYV